MSAERLRRLEQLATALGCELETAAWANAAGEFGTGYLIKDSEANVCAFRDLNAAAQWLINRVQ
jgi:hypothetical protein